MPADASQTKQARSLRQDIGLVAGPIVALLVYIALPDYLPQAARGTAFVVAWTAVWWMTEALHVAATALVPIAFLPLAASQAMSQTREFSHPIVYLLFGGLFLGMAIQRWNLHRRLALTILKAFGGSGAQLVAGFMGVSALISMWITNAAAAAMLLPVALWLCATIAALCKLTPEQDKAMRFALPVGLIYGASLGGMATLIGAAPNAFMASFASEQAGIEIGFVNWMLIGVPMLLLLFAAGMATAHLLDSRSAV